MSATEGAAASAATGSARSARPARQAPTDLTLTFVDDANVRALASATGEPEWLLADRLAGLQAFDALPIETNSLSPIGSLQKESRPEAAGIC